MFPGKRAYTCDVFPSSSITRLLRYHDVIRLPESSLPSFVIGCPAYSPPCKRIQGLPGFRVFAISDTPCSQTPGKRRRLASIADFASTSAELKASSFPCLSISGLNHFSLAAYGLPAHCPTLNTQGHPLVSKDALPGDWLCLPGWASHPPKHAALPGRTNAMPLPSKSMPLNNYSCITRLITTLKRFPSWSSSKSIWG